MTTQQQTDQPADLGERVAMLEGGFSELSVRIDTLQRSVDNLRSEVQAGDAALRAESQADHAALRAEIQAGDAALRAEIQAGDAALRAEIQAGDAALAQRIEALHVEMQAGFAALREDINRFKNQAVFYILGAGMAVGVGIGGAIIAADRLS